jgi:hypothetical protein
MTKNEAERCHLVYQMLSNRSNPTPKLYFILPTLAKTEIIHGAGGYMYEHMNEPLELGDILLDHPYSFVLKIYNGRKTTSLEDDYNTYYYDYRDVIIEEKTKDLIDFISSGGKSKKTPASKIQTYKFDEKTIYHFNKKEKFHKG